MHLISCDPDLHLCLRVDKYRSLHKVCQQSLHCLELCLMFMVDSKTNIGGFPFDDKVSIIGGTINFCLGGHVIFTFITNIIYSFSNKSHTNILDMKDLA